LLGVLPYFYPEPELQTDPAETRQWQSKLAAWKGKRSGKSVQPDSGVLVQNGSSTDEKNISPGTGAARNASNGNVPAALFPFDPNQLPADGWQRLGIPEKVIRTILNYLGKGGRFRKPEDLGRIYGMREKDVERLLPYVRIPERPKPVLPKTEGSHERSSFTNTPPASRKDLPNGGQGSGADITVPTIRRKKYSYIDINTADTSAWMSFPGIGSRLAFRIVQYREKLGGFHSADQVGETYALPDSTFQKIRPWLNCPNPVLRKIRINDAGVEELRQHPYLRWNLANAIVQYRLQHGPFHSEADLQNIILLNPLLISKIAPYLEY
jgi:DNA uptake protein ComE-like DNA-binding protein